MVALQNCCEMRGWEVLARQLLSSSVWSLLYIPQWFTNFWKCFCPQDWYCSRAGVSSRVLLLLRVKGWHILWLPHLLLENTAVFRMQDAGRSFHSIQSGFSESSICHGSWDFTQSLDNTPILITEFCGRMLSLHGGSHCFWEGTFLMVSHRLWKFLPPSGLWMCTESSFPLVMLLRGKGMALGVGPTPTQDIVSIFGKQDLSGNVHSTMTS